MLVTMLRLPSKPKAVRWAVSRWGAEPYTRGSYSYDSVGMDGSETYAALGRPVAGTLYVCVCRRVWLLLHSTQTRLHMPGSLLASTRVKCTQAQSLVPTSRALLLVHTCTCAPLYPVAVC